MPRHEHEPALLGELAQLLHLDAAHGRRLLDEDVLAGLEDALGELVVRRHRRCNHDRFDCIVGEHVVEVGGDTSVWVSLLEGAPLLPVRVAEPRQLRELVEVPDEILAPVAEAHLGETAHSFQTFPLLEPFLPVAFRKSTTSWASSTSRS